MLCSKVQTTPLDAGIKARRRRKTSKEERVCAVCGQDFKKAEHLARHVRSHTKEKPFHCPVCHKAFARQDTLLRHSRSHGARHDNNEYHDMHIETDYDGCLDPELTSQVPIASDLRNLPIHSEMIDDMISPPSSTSFDKPTPDISIEESNYPSQITPLTSFFSLDTHDPWRNQGSPPPPLWDPQLDQEWDTLLTGDDFDLNAVNMSLLCATSQYLPTAELALDSDMTASTTSQPMPVDDQAKQHSNMVQRRWHTYSEMSSSSGQMTPDVPHEGNYIDETYRKRLADRLQQRVQTGILPSTPFLDLCIQAYFSKFQPLFPVVHMPTFRPGTQNSILLLSICSVGSLFVGSARAVNHGISMFERLNKAILASWDTYTFKSEGSSLIALQASIIGQTFGLLLGRPKDLTGIEVFHGSIIAWARKARMFNVQLENTECHLNNAKETSLQDSWTNWIQNEVKQRIILGLYIHDALLARIHHHEPILRHSIDRLPKVSSNELFTASTAENWKSLMLQSQSIASDATTPSSSHPDFALTGILESINAAISEDQDRSSFSSSDSSLNSNWITTRNKYHTLLKDFHSKYSPSTSTSTSTKSTWPSHIIQWHSTFITLHTDINALECACGREGYTLSQIHAKYARSWIHSLDAKRVLFHAMLLQRSFESVPAGAESAIHVPISLYHCGIVWASFMCFGSGKNTTGTTSSSRQPDGEEQEQEHWQDPISLTAADVRHFDELGLPGVDVGVLLGQMGTVCAKRVATGSLFRIIDLLQRINHFQIAKSLAATLLAIVEETQGLF